MAKTKKDDDSAKGNNDNAEQKGVVKSTIDKCWALGHFLAATYARNSNAF